MVTSEANYLVGKQMRLLHSVAGILNGIAYVKHFVKNLIHSKPQHVFALIMIILMATAKNGTSHP